MPKTAQQTHLRLVYVRDETAPHDRLREAADAYLVAFRDLLGQFLAFEKISAVKIDSALRAAHDEPCLSLTIHEPGGDAIVNTKIFAAVNATSTFLDLAMDKMKLDDGRTWADVRVETRFAATSQPHRLRAV